MSYWHQLVGERSTQVLVHLSNSLWGFTSLKPWEWTWKFLMSRPGPSRTLSLCSDWQISKFKRAAHRLQFTQPHIIYFLENCFQRIYQNDENTAREDSGRVHRVQSVDQKVHVWCVSLQSPHNLSVLMLLIKRFKPIGNGIRRVCSGVKLEGGRWVRYYQSKFLSIDWSSDRPI